MDNFIFLGGTCGGNAWRDTIVIPGLLACGIAQEQIFNDDAARQREDEVKRNAKILLYVIASPSADMLSPTANVSAYSLVEAVMGLYDDPERTVVVFDTTGMANHAKKAIVKSMRDLTQRFPGAPIFATYEMAIDWIAARMR